MARSFGFVGGREVQQALADLAKIASPDVLRDAAAEGAAAIKAGAQQRVPVDTGALRDSIEVVALEQDSGAVLIGIGSPLPYARRIEFGFNGQDSLGRTYHQPAQPYLRPALDEDGAAAVASVAAELKARLSEVGGG